MKSTRMFLAGLFSALLSVTVVHADRTLRESSELLMAANEDTYVIHEHRVQFDASEEAMAKNTVVANIKSALRIFNKHDGKETFKKFVMPLTALVNIDGGEYFAGLSDLKTLSDQYNFILFTQDGRFVVKALITPTSDHCRAEAHSVTNTIRWFDKESPKVRLEFDNGRPVRAIVENPYDVLPDGEIGECIIQIKSDMTGTWPSPEGPA